jgi:hypothetical protein
VELITIVLRVRIAWTDVFPVADGVECLSHRFLVGVGLCWLLILVACPPVSYAINSLSPIATIAALSQITTIAVLIPITAIAVSF